MNNPQLITNFLQFLRQDLAMCDDSLDFIRRHLDVNQGNLPMLLWQYGLITLPQLDSIFDWIEHTGCLI